MKEFFVVLLAGALALSLTACGERTAPVENNNFEQENLPQKMLEQEPDLRIDESVKDDSRLTEEQREWIGVWEGKDGELVMIRERTTGDDFLFDIVGYDAFNDICYPITRNENTKLIDKNTIIDTYDCPFPWNMERTYESSVSLIKADGILSYSKDVYIMGGGDGASERNDTMGEINPDHFVLTPIVLEFEKNSNIDVNSIWDDYLQKGVEDY